LFATSVVDTSGKFATPVPNLPPVSTTTAELVATFADSLHRQYRGGGFRKRIFLKI
jgi:hypothetical protein